MDLRNYQTEAVERLRDAYRDGARRLLLQAGTGAGKTVIGAALMGYALERGSRILFLAHRRELVYQCVDKLTRFDHPCGILMSGHETSAVATQVASIQTLWSRMRRGRLPPPADLVVVDECHRTMARTYLEVLRAYPEAAVLGLTATPARLDGRGLGDVYEAMVQCPSIPELQRDGYLVPGRYFAPYTPDLQGVPIKAGDYS